MSDEFELFREQDFQGVLSINTTGRSYYDAKEVAKHANRLFREWLSKGTVVYGRKTFENYDWFSETERKATTFGQDTHTGIIVNIRPIEPADSAERLLSEILERTESPYYAMWADRVDREQWIERARRLLSKRSEK